MKRVFRFAPLAAAALAITAAGCGGSGRAELEAYFQESARIREEYQGSTEAAEALYNQLAGSEQAGEAQRVTAFQTLLEVGARNAKEEVAARAELEVPEQLFDLHVELVVARSQLANFLEEAREAVAGVETSAELGAALEGIDYQSRLDEAEGRALRACQPLQLFARQNDIAGRIC